jgi:hypothetical protein
MNGYSNEFLGHIRESVVQTIDTLHKAQALCGLEFKGAVKGCLFEQIFLKAFLHRTQYGFRSGKVKSEPDVVCDFDGKQSFEIKTASWNVRRKQGTKGALCFSMNKTINKPYVLYHLFVSNRLYWKFGAVPLSCWRPAGKDLYISSVGLAQLPLIDLYAFTERRFSVQESQSY